MSSVIAKTFGGLEPSYYFRNLFFALIFPAFYAFVFSRMPKPMPLAALTVIVVLFTLNTLLYPFSRFMYERVVGFIMGENVFFVNAILMLFVKLMTMAVCWAFAIFIAPVGLLYLYVHHTRAERR